MAVGIPNFPTSLDAASDLVEATNNASTTINMVGGLSNSATTITVVSTAAFPSTGIIRIDDELISYSAKTSTTFTVQTRGFESSTAASHNNGATVSLDITAASNNAKNTAIIALETKLGTGSSTPTANTVLRGTGTGTSAFGQVGLTTDVTGTLPAANGGTGITSLGAGVATFLGTPSSANLASAVTDETGSGALVFGTTPTISRPTIDNLSLGYTTTALTGGTTTLTNTSNFRQYFTGNATGHTVVLPVASTMVLGQAFEIYNRGDGPPFMINTSGGNGLVSVGYLLGVRVTCILTSGTGIASWDTAIIGSQFATGNFNQVFSNSPSLTDPLIAQGGFRIQGSSSGQTTIITSAVGSGTVTIPAGTATLATVLPSVALSPTSSNPTVTLNQRHFINLSGLTANRNFVLPAGAVGDVIVVSITAGHATNALLLIGASGITINGGSAATEWSRLFITGESVTFVANSTTNWQVLEDGRIPSVVRMFYSGNALTIANDTNTQATLTNKPYDNASMGSTSTGKVTIRRANKYILTGGYGYANLTANVARINTWIGTVSITHTANEVSALAGSFPLISCVTTVSLNVNDVIELWTYQASGGALTTRGGPENINLAVTEVLT